MPTPRKPPAARRKPGPKPSGIVARAIDEICQRHSEGENLDQILPAKDRPKHLPSCGHWYTALSRNEPPGIAEAFTRARENWTHAKANECIQIADDAGGDAVIDYRSDGTAYARYDGEAVQRSKLRIETRMRLVGKLNRRVYGENVDVTSAGQSVSPIALLPMEMLLPKGKKPPRE